MRVLENDKENMALVVTVHACGSHSKCIFCVELICHRGGPNLTVNSEGCLIRLNF